MKPFLASLFVGLLVPVAANRAWGDNQPPLPPASGVPPVAVSAGARIQFATPVYDFGKTSAGEPVDHNFVFTNTGTATLEISGVRPTCGCTTSGTWDRQVAPGTTGSIPIRFNPSSYSGTVVKTIVVTCNDPTQPNVILQLKGVIWRPIEVSASTLFFNVINDAETNETKVVRIVSNLDEALTLSPPQCTNRAFQVALATVRPGKEFELRVTAVPPFGPALTQAPITIPTSSAKMPSIIVNAYGMAQPAVMVMPTQLVLPAGPLTGPVRTALMIRNNGRAPLKLSDGSVNVTNAQVQVIETLPGRLFNVGVIFPTGLLLQPGQKILVSLKSDHPKYPLISVPVFQQARPAVPRPPVRPALAPRPRPVPTGGPPPLPPLPPVPGK